MLTSPEDQVELFFEAHLSYTDLSAGVQGAPRHPARTSGSSTTTTTSGRRGTVVRDSSRQAGSSVHAQSNPDLPGECSSVVFGGV